MSGPSLQHDDEGSITALLQALREGDREAGAKLLPLLYGDLRRVAAAHMRRERPNHTLQPTALVNEVWMRVGQQGATACANRAHFLAFASIAMRRILVDHARKRAAGRRGGGVPDAVAGDDLADAAARNPAEILAVHEAIKRLRGIDERAARVVEMHFFGGTTFEEMAEVLDVTTRTIRRDWQMARAWLRGELSSAR